MFIGWQYVDVETSQIELKISEIISVRTTKKMNCHDLVEKFVKDRDESAVNEIVKSKNETFQENNVTINDLFYFSDDRQKFNLVGSHSHCRVGRK